MVAAWEFFNRRRNAGSFTRVNNGTFFIVSAARTRASKFLFIRFDVNSNRTSNFRRLIGGCVPAIPAAFKFAGEVRMQEIFTRTSRDNYLAGKGILKLFARVDA